jgi:MPBQ/MSBQ methyltransferase
MPMPNNADLRLTPDELSLIEAHLREQYRGVFDEKMIAAHLSEFVESSFADNLAAVIASDSQAGATLLDIGSGYGAFVLSCRRRGLDAMGYELAGFEVELSRQRLARAEPAADPVAVFHKGDAGRLPFPDGKFQIVTLFNVLEHVPDYRMVLAEAARVLLPGGRLIVVCPNYAAFRKEAHYHVPWLPMFPRHFASAYLRWLGRNPGFFERDIYYCANWGVLSALKSLGLRASSLDMLRLDHPELFASARARSVLNFIGKAHLRMPLKVVLMMNHYNPFKAAVTLVADKGSAR